MIYRTLHKIGLSILLIGLLNIYNILKYGISINLPTTPLSELLDQKLISNNTTSSEGYFLSKLGLIKIDLNTIRIVIFITILISVIFNLDKLEDIKDKRNTVEYELLIGFGLLGLMSLLISNELISLYLGLELYSFSTYILIITKETINIRRIAIIYLILSSITSAIILYSFITIYKTFGILNFDFIEVFFKTIYIQNIPYYIIYLISLAFLFKIGTGPFIYWLIRLYSDLDKRILLYQLTIPKLVFLILFIKFINLFFSNSNTFTSYFAYFIYIVAILSIIIGAIGGLFQKKDNLLLSYSSVLNIGYILITISLFLLTKNSLIGEGLTLTKSFSGGNSIIILDKLWIIFQYIYIYILNIIGLFAILLLYRRTSNVYLLQINQQPYLFICLISIIFSLIGIPPFSGFFSKLYLIFTFFSFSYITIITIIIFLMTTIISSFYYFKFLFPTSFKSNNNPQDCILNTPSFSTYIISFSTIFSILYFYYIPFFIPLLF